MEQEIEERNAILKVLAIAVINERSPSQNFDPIKPIARKILDKLKEEEDRVLLKELIDALSKHCGDRGDDEGATETLFRIIDERRLMAQAVLLGVDATQDQLDLANRITGGKNARA